ncbi:MAG: cohesin domain-containing protein, partial [Defluviitaleaceae bacterium]|nr:cohesin domain-containing protein [Defluviitaleaceae bacterium]
MRVNKLKNGLKAFLAMVFLAMILVFTNGIPTLAVNGETIIIPMGEAETPIVISGSEETVMQHAEGEDAYVDVALRVDSWSEAYDLFALQFWVVFDAEELTPVELTSSALLPIDELPELSDEMSFVFFDLEMFGVTDPGELATIRFRINDTSASGEIPVTLIPVSGHVTSWDAATTERPVEVGTQGLITIEPVEDVPIERPPADETPIVISGSEETVMQHAEGEDAYVDVALRVDSWSEAYDLFALQFWVVFDAEALTPVELTPSALLPLDELPELSDEMSFVFFDLEMFGA